uniref:Uncharacterized protein n=1 Tax=Opuntia streptacantha TaxID=393608 RepID=A0A7C9A6C3_OPUST
MTSHLPQKVKFLRQYSIRMSWNPVKEQRPNTNYLLSEIRIPAQYLPHSPFKFVKLSNKTISSPVSPFKLERSASHAIDPGTTSPEQTFSRICDASETSPPWQRILMMPSNADNIGVMLLDSISSNKLQASATTPSVRYA